jgi:uncharacterized protein Veg
MWFGMTSGELVNNIYMRKTGLSIESIREKINELIGKNIYMEVCRGRKQIKKYNGVVEYTFPSVFVVRLTDSGQVVSSLSYSYSDVLCGDVIIQAK